REEAARQSRQWDAGLAAEPRPGLRHRPAEEALGPRTVEEDEGQLAGEAARAGLLDLDGDADHAARLLRDAAAADDLRPDAHRPVQRRREVRREAELAEEPDERPGADLVGEPGDPAAGHDAGHDRVAVAREREPEAEGVVGAAAEAGLAGSEEPAVERVHAASIAHVASWTRVRPLGPRARAARRRSGAPRGARPARARG